MKTIWEDDFFAGRWDPNMGDYATWKASQAKAPQLAFTVPPIPDRITSLEEAIDYYRACPELLQQELARHTIRITHAGGEITMRGRTLALLSKLFNQEK